MSKSLSFFRQHDVIDCGASCPRMVAKYYSKNYTFALMCVHYKKGFWVKYWIYTMKLKRNSNENKS
jgi:hypothetical protein